MTTEKTAGQISPLTPSNDAGYVEIGNIIDQLEAETDSEASGRIPGTCPPAPKKPPRRRKSVSFLTRCYPEELIEIEAAAASIEMNRSDFIIMSARGMIPMARQPMDYGRMLTLLAGAGNNLNQAMRWCHLQGEAADNADMKRLENAVIEATRVNNELKGLARALLVDRREATLT